MIEVDRLTKRYGPVPAIQDVSFTVEKGQIVGFLGPNGARQDDHDADPLLLHARLGGTARVAGYDVFEQSLEVRRRIGYLPENAAALRRHDGRRVPRLRRQHQGARAQRAAGAASARCWSGARFPTCASG